MKMPHAARKQTGAIARGAGSESFAATSRLGSTQMARTSGALSGGVVLPPS